MLFRYGFFFFFGVSNPNFEYTLFALISSYALSFVSDIARPVVPTFTESAISYS